MMGDAGAADIGGGGGGGGFFRTTERAHTESSAARPPARSFSRGWQRVGLNIGW